MKKCPVCNIDLLGINYERFRILHCGRCAGHLVPLQRLDSIKRVDQKSPEELEADASSEFKTSSQRKLACPRCHMPMQKKSANLPAFNLQTDVCSRCELIWLDGGEIALLQLAYQATRKFMNAQEVKRRMQELNASPQRKAKFEQDLARLPQAKDPLEEVATELGQDVLRLLLKLCL